MKKAFWLVPISCFCALMFSSCRETTISGSGAIIADQRSVSSFTAVEISVPLKAIINVNPASAAALKLTGYGNMLKYIKAEVKDNKLRIFTDPGVKLDDEQYLNAEISIPALVSLELDGAPDAEVHGTITGADLALAISGSSDVSFDNVSTTHFSTTVSGAGDVQVKGGTVQKAEYTVSGAGDIKAFQLQSMESEATVSGAGNIELNAQQKLDAQISGAGSVRYKGKPVVSSSVSGVGGVENAN